MQCQPQGMGHRVCIALSGFRICLLCLPKDMHADTQCDSTGPTVEHMHACPQVSKSMGITSVALTNSTPATIVLGDLMACHAVVHVISGVLQAANVCPACQDVLICLT